MDLELFSRYIGKATPCMKSIVELARVIQEQEQCSDDKALTLAHQLCDQGIKALLAGSINLGDL